MIWLKLNDEDDDEDDDDYDNGNDNGYLILARFFECSIARGLRYGWGMKAITPQPKKVP